jgi:serine phosphatase RsbU (regulator of sigma subunit)
MALPLLVIVLVAAADAALGRDRFLTPMMVTAPALAAITTTWRRTLVVGATGLVVMAALAPIDGVLSPHERRLAQGEAVSYLAVAAFSVYIARQYERGRSAYNAVTSVAEAAQRAILPPPGPRVGDVRTAVRFASAVGAARIGGDLYAVLDTPFGVRVLVGDVRGKGLGAVRTAAVTLGAFREAAYDEGELAEVARRVDASIGRHAKTGEFVTAMFAQFDEPGSVLLLHCGHVAPLRVSAGGAVDVLDPPDPFLPLGLAGITPGDPHPWREPLAPDDTLVLLTDGAVEARSPRDGRFYPLPERAGPLITGSPDPETALDRLFADLVRFAGGTLADDTVLMLLSRAAPDAAGAGEGATGHGSTRARDSARTGRG